MKRSSPLLIVVLLALGIGACGSTVSTSSFKGEAHAVAQRIADLQSDVSALNEQKICEQDFSRAARERLWLHGNILSTKRLQAGAQTPVECDRRLRTDS